MEEILSQVQDFAQSEYLSVGYMKYLGILVAGLLVLSLIGRFATGGSSVFRSAIAAMVGMLFMYIVIVGMELTSYQLPLPKLPFVDVVEQRVYVLSMTQTDLNAISLELLDVLILTLFIAILDGFLPEARVVLVWVLRSVLLLALSFACQALISYGFVTYLPAVVVQWAPMILLGICVLVMLLGLIKLILGVALATVNPVLAAIYGFFFMHRIGKKLSAAVLATMILGAIFYLTDYFGYTVLSLASANPVLCAPFLVLLLALWYMVG